MKNLILVIIVCLPFVASAQIEKGKSFITGAFGLSADKTGDTSNSPKTVNFSIGAQYGYLVADTWAVGISPGFGFAVTKNPDKTEHHEEAYVIGPFVRKYFPIGDGGKFYVHLDLGYSYQGVRQWGVGANGQKGAVATTSAQIIGFTPGASYFLTEKIALQASIGALSYTKYKDAGSNVDFNFGINSLSLGASVYF